MPATIEKNCKSCGKLIVVRLADHKRGWGNYCNKSCKAIKQTQDTKITGPDYRAIGRTVKQMRRGKYAKSLFAGGKKTKAPKNGIFRNGERMTCAVCGDWATNGVESILSHHPVDPIHGYRIEWTCDRHFDDTHPFSGDAFD